MQYAPIKVTVEVNPAMRVNEGEQPEMMECIMLGIEDGYGTLINPTTRKMFRRVVQDITITEDSYDQILGWAQEV